MIEEMRVEPWAKRPLISVVVPAYNEGSQLSANLETLMRTLRLPEQHYDYEVIVVDDGSADQTYGEALRTALAYPNMRVLRHASNRGLGCALRTGFAASEGAIVVVYDSDLSYRPEIIEQMAEELEHRDADVVLASAYMRGGSVQNVPWLRRVLSREANRFLSYATNGRYRTITCMVRAYRATLLRKLPTLEERMEINVELLFKAIKAGARIVEIPASLEWSTQRADSPSRLGARATFKQIARTLRYGVAHRPAVLLALPAILPGVLPLVVALSALAHASLKTIAIVTLVTMVIQNASLALFAGQLGVFMRNLMPRSQARDATVRR